MGFKSSDASDYFISRWFQNPIDVRHDLTLQSAMVHYLARKQVSGGVKLT